MNTNTDDRKAEFHADLELAWQRFLIETKLEPANLSDMERMIFHLGYLAGREDEQALREAI